METYLGNEEGTSSRARELGERAIVTPPPHHVGEEVLLGREGGKRIGDRQKQRGRLEADTQWSHRVPQASRGSLGNPRPPVLTVR